MQPPPCGHRSTTTWPAAGAKKRGRWHENCIDTLQLRNQNTRLVFSWEGYPSGQREQTVNLPAYAFVGSNPTPSTTELQWQRQAQSQAVFQSVGRVPPLAGVVQW